MKQTGLQHNPQPSAMKNHITIPFTIILLFQTSILLAQSSHDQDKEEVMEVFELFFDSMRERDTTALKTCIHFSLPDRWFFKQFSGTEQQLGGSSASKVDGFLKTVADESGIVGKCQNELDDIDIQIYQRFAVVTAHYQCIVDDRINNKGIYTVQLLKSDTWRIESVTRYVERVE